MEQTKQVGEEQTLGGDEHRCNCRKKHGTSQVKTSREYKITAQQASKQANNETNHQRSVDVRCYDMWREENFNRQVQMLGLTKYGDCVFSVEQHPVAESCDVVHENGVVQSRFKLLVVHCNRLHVQRV